MKTILLLLTALVLHCLTAVPVFADSVPSCVAGTSVAALQQLGGCESGGLLFSNFQYNNGGLQISPGIYVTPSDVLVTATPFSVTFSTDYGLGGGFTNCLIATSGQRSSSCVEEEGSLGYDVTAAPGSEQIAGLGLFGGDVPGLLGGHVAEIACLGAGNDANVFSVGFGGYAAYNVPSACPQNPNASALLNGVPASYSGLTPSTAAFTPVPSLSVAISLFVEPGEAIQGLPAEPSNVTPFSNAFLLVPRQVAEASSLSLLGPWLLVLWRGVAKRTITPSGIKT